MKRKVLLIVGKGEYAFKTEKFINVLEKRKDIDLVVVGQYNSKNFDCNKLQTAISNLNSEQELTIITMAHGTYSYNEGFEFLLGDNFRLSSKDFFTMIREKMQEMPVDVFNIACQGGGMMFDKDLLPKGSVLVSLTDHQKENNAGDFNKMSEHFEEFNNNEITAYNLLQFYLSRFLKNKFQPYIGVSGGYSYSLYSLFKAQLSRPMDFDYNHFNMIGRPEKYKEIFDKIVSNKNEFLINAAEYGIALSIILNNINNKGYLSVKKDNNKTR